MIMVGLYVPAKSGDFAERVDYYLAKNILRIKLFTLQRSRETLQSRTSKEVNMLIAQ